MFNEDLQLLRQARRGEHVNVGCPGGGRLWFSSLDQPYTAFEINIETYRRLEAVRYLSHSSGQTTGLISESVGRFHPYDISRYGGRSDERNQPTTIRG